MRSSLFTDEIAGAKACWASWKPLGRITGSYVTWGSGCGAYTAGPPDHLARKGIRPVMNEDRHWSMVRGLKKPGDLLARSDLCHLHDGRAEAECCAIDDKLQIHLVRIDPNVGDRLAHDWLRFVCGSDAARAGVNPRIVGPVIPYRLGETGGRFRPTAGARRRRARRRQGRLPFTSRADAARRAPAAGGCGGAPKPVGAVSWRRYFGDRSWGFQAFGSLASVAGLHRRCLP